MVSSVEKGIKFQNEVEVYFKKLLALKNKQNKNGFGSVKNRSNAPGHDIIVTFRNFGYNKNLKIIIQAKDIQKSYNIYEDRNSYKSIRKDVKAALAILLINTDKLTDSTRTGKKILLDDTRRKEILDKDKVVIWGRRQYAYYKKLIDTLGQDACYSLFSDWGKSIFFSREKYIKFNAMPVQQDAVRFFLTAIPVEFLLKTGFVLRKNLDLDKGFQRLLKKSRITKDFPNDIHDGEFGEKIFPSTIIVTTANDSPLKFKNGKLKLPLKYGELKIIDGQHRVYGLAKAGAQKLVLPVSVFEPDSLNTAQEVQLFVTINKKAKKPPVNLLWDLDKESLLAKVARAVNEKGPLKRMISFDENTPKGKIAAQTFISGLNSVLNEKRKGGGREYFGYLYDISNKNTNDLVDNLNGYLSIWRKAFKKEWGKEKYIIASNRGIRVIFSLMKDIYGFYHYDRRGKEHILKILKTVHAKMNDKKRLRIVDVTNKYLGAGGTNEFRSDIISYTNDFEFQEYAGDKLPKEIDSGGIEEFQKILKRAVKSLVIMDPYLDRKALTALGIEFNCKDIKLFTSDAHIDSGFKSDFKEFKKEVTWSNKKVQNIECRILPKDKFRIHRRIINLDDKYIFHGGLSINMFGGRKYEHLEKANFNERSSILKKYQKYFISDWSHATKLENYTKQRS